MKKFRNSLVMAMTAGALAIVPASSTRTTQVVGRGDPDPKAIYSKNTKEFYLTAEEFGYIRPGLKITVNSITINAGPASGRRRHVHRRPGPAARPQRQGHAPARSR